MNDITSFSVSEIKAGFEKKDFSAVDATMAYLDRIEKGKKLNSFITVTSEEALKQAKAADEKIGRGEKAPLLGVPVGVKDIICTSGVRTTCASRILENFIPPYDATVVSKLKAAGAVIIGKTNCDEFAMGSSSENSFFGPTRNPWNLDYVPGGSSGGSGASVAARFCPVALGTDTGGSIRLPASFCNVVGLRPTYGRVSRYGVVAYASSLDQVGSFGRTVRDCAITTQVISGYDPLDSTSIDTPVPNFSAMQADSINGLRVGIPDEYFIKGIEPDVEKAVREAIKHLGKLGATIVPISLPHTSLALPCYYILAPAEASSNLARFDGVRYGYRASGAKDLEELYFRSRTDGFSTEVKRRIMVGTFVLSTGYYDAYYLQAQKVRTLIAGDFKKAFGEKCDIIACPVSPTSPFKLGEKMADPLSMYLSDVFTVTLNLAGLPGMSLPCGFDAKGLPIGLQLMGKPFDEATIFRLALAYEASTDWHKRSAKDL